MRNTLSGLALIAALLAAAPTLADDKAVIPANTFYKGQQANQYLAKDMLLRAKVRNDEGKVIGDIEDLIINSENQVEGVIMGVGGFLNLGEKKVGVRLSALKISEKDGKTVVNLPGASRDVLKALEPYKRAKPPKSLFDRAMEKAQELSDKTLETSKDAYQAAKEQVGPAYEKAKKQATEAYEKAKKAMQPGAEETPKQ
jgi:PRC-barrel domain